jgi:hypothetical protein
LAQRLAPHVAKLPEKLLLRSTKAQLKLTAEAVNMNMNTEKTYENRTKVGKRSENESYCALDFFDGQIPISEAGCGFLAPAGFFGGKASRPCQQCPSGVYLR